MVYQDSKNLINSIKFDNLLDLVRAIKQQSDKFKLSGITFITIVEFYN